MPKRIAQPWIKTSVNIPPEMYYLAKQHYLKFSEAMRIGISVMLSEKGVDDFVNELNIGRQLQQLKQKFAIISSKYYKTQEGQKELRVDLTHLKETMSVDKEEK